MYDDCPACGFHYEIEPGFFWGAMYVSYGFTVMLALMVLLPVHYLLHSPGTYVYLAYLVGALLLTSPAIFQYSRLLMLYWFASAPFDKDVAAKVNGRDGK